MALGDVKIIRYQLSKFENPEMLDHLLISTCVDGVPLTKVNV